jgi:dynein heavy chain
MLNVCTASKAECHLLFSTYQLVAILREVHYLNLIGHKDIPEAALRIYEQNETFRKYTSNLDQTIQW